MFRLTAVIVWAINLSLSCQGKPSANTLGMPDSCIGKSFCLIKHQQYPEQVIEKLLKNKFSRVKGGSVRIGSARSSVDHNENICNTTIIYDKIYQILDESNRVRFVVQSDETFTHTVRIEECVNPGRITSESNFFSEDDLMTFNVFCEQKWMEHEFLVLKLDMSGIESAKVKNGLPVYCSCRMMLNDLR